MKRHIYVPHLSAPGIKRCHKIGPDLPTRMIRRWVVLSLRLLLIIGLARARVTVCCTDEVERKLRRRGKWSDDLKKKKAIDVTQYLVHYTGIIRPSFTSCICWRGFVIVPLLCNSTGDRHYWIIRTAVCGLFRLNCSTYHPSVSGILSVRAEVSSHAEIQIIIHYSP